MLVMVAGSVIAALRPNFALVVTGRALQGFAAALIPVGISILRDELPREKVPSAVALMSATLGIGGGIGLPLSGLIYEHLGWQAIFWSSAAIGVVLIVAVLAIVPESAIRTRGRFDYVGAVLLSIALTSLLLAISKGGTLGLDERADPRAVPGRPGGAGGLGAVRAARQPADGGHPHLDPQAGAAHQHRVGTGGLRDVRQPARHHPAAAAPGEHRLRLRPHRRRRRAVHAAQQPGDGGVRAGLGRDHPTVRCEDHTHHRMRAAGRRLRGPRVPHRARSGRSSSAPPSSRSAPPSATPRCPL